VIRLIRVEVSRYASRRLVRIMVGLAVLGVVIAGIVVFARSHRLDPADLRRQTREAQALHDQLVQECIQSFQPQDLPPGVSAEEFCSGAGEVGTGDPRFHLTSLRDVFLGTNGLLIAMFLVLGASFLGAEWHAGTMTTLLTWEPRRPRVILTKIGVAAAMAFLGTVVLQTLLGGLLTPAAMFRGTTEGANAAWLGDVAGLVLRAGAVAAIAATIGAALASIGRNTAAALGVTFGYIAIVENLMRGLRPGWSSWLVGENLAAFLVADPSDVLTVGHSVAAAGLILGMYTVAMASVAALVFIRRDVT
jgi:ABC-type transport system involved in multi-copper enzyme maturation permease subunit